MSLVPIAIYAAIEAGKQIMSVYGGNHQIELKDDRSPLTIADKLANHRITEILKQTSLPVLSEEGRAIPFHERKQWDRFWMVDPLDGTKEFIKRNGEFTVNIALIENHVPAAGVIYAPVPDILYYGSAGNGSYKIINASQVITGAFADDAALENLNKLSVKLPSENNHRPFTIIASRSHLSDATSELVEALRIKHGTLNFISKGSSLKICLVAEGTADVYPRLAPTMEWDTAAGQAIAVHAGCTMVVHPGGQLVVYNKEDLLNPHFIVSRK